MTLGTPGRNAAGTIPSAETNPIGLYCPLRRTAHRIVGQRPAESSDPRPCLQTQVVRQSAGIASTPLNAPLMAPAMQPTESESPSMFTAVMTVRR